MTLEQLRVFLNDRFCGCGQPEAAAERLRDLLALHPLYSNRPKFEALVPDSGIQMLLLYMLDKWDLTEHGGGVGGGWLTELGEEVLAALNAHDFKTIMEPVCIHGRPLNGDCAECQEDGDGAKEFRKGNLAGRLLGGGVDKTGNA